MEDALEIVETETEQPRILVVFAGSGAIVDAMIHELRSRGFCVEVADVIAGFMPPPQDYDAVMVGWHSGHGAHTRWLVDYVSRNRVGLAEVPTALFTVNRGTLGAELGREIFLDAVSWRPMLQASFASYETDWPAVHEFADAFTREVARSPTCPASARAH